MKQCEFLAHETPSLFPSRICITMILSLALFLWESCLTQLGKVWPVLKCREEEWTSHMHVDHCGIYGFKCRWHVGIHFLQQQRGCWILPLYHEWEFRASQPMSWIGSLRNQGWNFLMLQQKLDFFVLLDIDISFSSGKMWAKEGGRSGRCPRKFSQTIGLYRFYH